MILYFQNNESNIDRSGQILMETWMKEVNPNKLNGIYKITAFSSIDGKREKNLKLAQQRLNAGKESLLKLGVSPLQIQIKIGGVEERIEGGRRVEIEFLPLQEVTD